MVPSVLLKYSGVTGKLAKQLNGIFVINANTITIQTTTINNLFRRKNYRRPNENKTEVKEKLSQRRMPKGLATAESLRWTPTASGRE